ncbi:hypothetical protein KAU11_04520, partial [Candidatus Babeliales bacterium]|nr:hypothetical protein [Candidatus Babeliales bacterium]
MSKEKLKLGLRFANAVIDPKTINEEDRSVEVTFATETPVEQYIMGEYGFEVLRCANKNIDLGRFKAGVVPLLDTHNRYSIKGQLGAASNPVIADETCRCTITFSKREEVEPIWQDVKDGIIKGISAGYRVVQYIVDRTIGETPYFYANKWEPREISLAPVPADGNSNIRSSVNDEDLNECEIIEKSRTEMTEKEKLAAKKIADEKIAAEKLEAKTRAAGGT